MKAERRFFPEHATPGRIPARAAVGNLVWTHGGSVWGVWRAAPVSYRWLSHAGKLSYHEGVRQAILALPPEALALSVCPPLDRVTAATSLLRGAEDREAWRTEAEESLGVLTVWDPFERWFYLAGRLGSGGGWRGEAKEQASAVIRRAFVRPTERDIATAVARAKKVEDGLRRSLTITNPGPNEVRWLYARSLRRGIRDLEIPPREADEVTAPGFSSIGAVLLTEGGDGTRGRRGFAPRVLTVEEPHRKGEAFGYQVHLALADMPVFDFPTPEATILYALESFGYPVDWAVKWHRMSNDESRRMLVKKSKALVTELGNEGQGAEIERTGSVPPDLVAAFEASDARREHLTRNKSEGNLKTTIAMSVWGRTRAEAEARAEKIADALAPNEWGLARPVGGQAGLLEMSMIGGRESPVVWNYAQHITPTDLAGLGMFAGSDIGDSDGMLLGARMDCESPRPVYWNPEGPLDAGISASVGFCGAPGSGKSYLGKRGAHTVLARGGTFAAVDRTEEGEWVAFSDAMAREGFSTSVVTTDADAHGSFDPFRIFGDLSDQKAYATGICLLVTQSKANDLQGICVTDAVEEVASLPSSRRSLAKVLSTLERYHTEGRHGAEEAFLTVRAFARGPFGRMAFDDSLPPADLSADLVVFHVPGLDLPDRETMKDASLAAALLPEQLGALGVFYLIAAAARSILLADSTRFAVFDGDEAWAYLATAQGAALLESTAREGRHKRAALWLQFQHAADLSDPRLLSLLTVRFVFGQGEGAGQAAARFLGVEPTESVVAKLTETEGKGGIVRRDNPDAPPSPARLVMRDSQGRIGEVVVRPASPRLARALETNPKRLAAWGPEVPPDAVKVNGNGSVRPEVLIDAGAEA